MSLTSGFAQLRSGFSSTFWIANGLELFERFAYYGSKAVLVVYVAEQVGLGPELAGWLVLSLFNTLLYLLPIVAGTIVDRFGFKRSLLVCFAVLSIGYLLIGLAGLPAGQTFVGLLGRRAYMVMALVVTAVGGSLIKPSIVGTVARTTTDATKSLGYSIYYMLVNVGGVLGPMLATVVRQRRGIAYVLVMSSATTLILIVATLLFFREPPRPKDAPPARSFVKVLRDMAMVFGNLRFIGFLVIFSGFWIMFWQMFSSLPFYVRDVLKFERFEIFETFDAWTIILITVLATALAKKLRPILAMTLGFALAAASWFLIVFAPPALAQIVAVPVVAIINLALRLLLLLGLPVTTMTLTPVLAPTIFGLVVFAVGEALQAPRYYEYVADLAPKEQVGTYMGFAFLPIAIGTFVAGAISGKLVTHFIQGPGAAAPERMWIVVGLIGVVSTILMVLYDRLVATRPTAR